MRMLPLLLALRLTRCLIWRLLAILFTLLYRSGYCRPRLMRFVSLVFISVKSCLIPSQLRRLLLCRLVVVCCRP